MKQLDFMDVDTARDLGMNQALNHANSVIPEWSETALKCLISYLYLRGNEPFLAEDVRAYGQCIGLEAPPSERAWGGVMTRAARAGLIEAIGYAKTSNPLAHRTPASLWRKR